MSFSYVKQKSEDSPKVSVNIGHAESLIGSLTYTHTHTATLQELNISSNLLCLPRTYHTTTALLRRIHVRREEGI